MKEKAGTAGNIGVLVLTAMTAAVFCVVGPISIPIGPIPLSLMTLVLYLALYVIGYRLTLVACALYLLIGMVGVPVFSGPQGGLGKLAGPTGGYLIGYLPMILIGGLLIALVDRIQKKKGSLSEPDASPEKGGIWMRRVLQALALILATVVLYVLGTTWFVISTGTPVGAALMACVVPFLPGDMVKIVIAVVVGPEIGRRIRRAY